MYGRPIDAACNSSGAEAEVLTFQDPQYLTPCTQSGRCAKPLRATTYTIKCPRGAVRSAIEVWGSYFVPKDIILRKVRYNRAWVRQFQGAPWYAFPPGWVPVVPSIHMVEREVVPRFTATVPVPSPTPAKRAVPSPPPPDTDALSYKLAVMSVEGAPLFQIVILAALGFFGFVATNGYFDEEYPHARRKAQFIVVVCMAIFIFSARCQYLHTSGMLQSGTGSTWRASVFALTFLLLFPYYVLRFIMRIPRGFYYTFVSHPAAPVVNHAVKTDSRIDGKRLAKTLDAFGDRAPGHKWWVPNWVYRSDAQKARELADKLDADAEIARAAVARERARRARKDVEENG